MLRRDDQIFGRHPLPQCAPGDADRLQGQGAAQLPRADRRHQRQPQRDEVVVAGLDEIAGLERLDRQRAAVGQQQGPGCESRVSEAGKNGWKWLVPPLYSAVKVGTVTGSRVMR